jgi:hypothetical protein
MLDQISRPALLDNLLKALAFQVGSEVSYSEVGKLIGANIKTVEKYIDLLEKAFVVFQLNAFSRNVRNEISKGKKIYFYACGIRNAIIKNFRPLAGRDDVGALWENFVITERMKFLRYLQRDTSHYFWRTTQQQEIDLIEESRGQLRAFECKWGKNVRSKFSKTFTENYPDAKTTIVTPENIEDLIYGSNSG